MPGPGGVPSLGCVPGVGVCVSAWSGGGGWCLVWGEGVTETATAAGGMHPTGMHSCFCLKFREFIARNMQKIIFCDVRFNPHLVRLNQTLENSEKWNSEIMSLFKF